MKKNNKNANVNVEVNTAESKAIVTMASVMEESLANSEMAREMKTFVNAAAGKFVEEKINGEVKPLDDNGEVFNALPKIDELNEVDGFDKAATPIEGAASEVKGIEVEMPATVAARAPKVKILMQAKINERGQLLIHEKFDHLGPMHYVLSTTNKKMRVNSDWAVAMINGGAALKVSQETIDEMKGKAKTEKTSTKTAKTAKNDAEKTVKYNALAWK